MENGLNFDFVEVKEEKPTQVGASAAMKIRKSDHSLNAELAKKKFAIFEDKIRKVLLEVRKFEVKTEDDCKDLTEALGQASKLRNSLDEKRKEIIKDADGFVRSINAFVKSFRDTLLTVDREGKKKIGDFTYKLEMKRREDQKAMEDEQARQQEEINKAAKKKHIEPVTLPTMVAPQKKGPVRSGSGASSSTRMVWTFEVVSMEKVPRKYLMLDTHCIKKAIDAGIRSIEGLRIYEKPQVSVRRSI